MDLIARRFVMTSLIFLLFGVTFWAVVGAGPLHEKIENIKDMDDKVHVAFYLLQLYGFVAMMIFGISYHVLPRFTGNEIYSNRLANLHYVFVVTGTIGMSLFKLLQGFLNGMFGTLFWLASILLAVGTYIYVYNIIKSFPKTE